MKLCSMSLAVVLYTMNALSMQQPQDLGEVLRKFDNSYAEEKSRFEGRLTWENGGLTVGAHIISEDKSETRAQCLQTLMQAQGQTHIHYSTDIPDNGSYIVYRPTLCRGDNGMLSTAFDVFSNTQHVTRLDISYNILQEIPLARITRQCPNLKAFKVGNNSITYLSLHDEKTQEIHNNLETLDLSGNCLQDLNIGFLLLLYPKLQHINVSNNPLTTIDWETDTIPCENLVINCSNTWLSQEAKHGLLYNYGTRQLQPIFAKKNRQSVMLWTGLMLAGYMLDSTATMMAASVAAPIIGSLWYFSELKRMAEKAKSNVLFEDSN